MKKDRVYVDTSIIGGCLDEEFAEWSLKVVDLAKRGRIVLMVSDLPVEELQEAPEEVRKVLPGIPASSQLPVRVNDETNELLQANLKEKIVSRRYTTDAHHVAMASVHRSDVLLSWNFKHIVHLDKIRKFNAVNLRLGYALVEIRSPKEYV
jgi:predicted nucleic acid-binding protein